MKLNSDVNDVVLSGVGPTGEFKIRNSAKAFSILSSGLYSNKIRAIVRELSCNAVDSHVGAGKAEIPFEVHLPTVFEPWFAVKDFGMGLDNDQVINIYTTYFESTKTNSNDFIGALGLGSKSPFSYTENFTVTAIKNGYKRIYSAFINEQGVPSIAEMSEELTDEGNGVEVKFSVTNKSDYYSFKNEAQNVFKWFKLQPVITGADLEVYPVEYKEKDIVPGIHIYQGSHISMAIMGNIAYPLNNIPEAEKHFGKLCQLLDCNLVIEFNIGELDFAASREQLSYIPSTIANIKAKLEELNKNLATHLATKANAIDNEWKRAEFLCNEARTRLYTAAVHKYVVDTNFQLFDPTQYYGRKTFKYSIADLDARKLSVLGFTVQTSYHTKHPRTGEYVGNVFVPDIRIPVEERIVIILNDLKTGCLTRARYHYGRHSNFNSRVSVFCVSHSDPDITVRQKEYDKLIAELHNPPIVLKASTLAKIERSSVSVKTTGIAEVRLKSGNQYKAGESQSYMWSPLTDELDPDETYFYVALNGSQSVDDKGNETNFFNTQALMDSCGVPEIADINVYGVRKSRIKEISALPNWVHVDVALTAAIKNVSDEHFTALQAADILDTYRDEIYVDKRIAAATKKISPDSEYVKFVEECAKIPRREGNVTQLVTLCKKYDPTFVTGNAKDTLSLKKQRIMDKYPMLSYLRRTSETIIPKDVAAYIALVDSAEKV